MWLLPFALGLIAGAIGRQVISDKIEDTEQQILREVRKVKEELKSELLPHMSEQLRSGIREEIEAVKDMFPSFLRRHVQDEKDRYGFVSVRHLLGRFPGILEALAMYYCLLDYDTPLWVKARVAGALLYLIAPNDLIPDDQELGPVDDAAVIAHTFSVVRDHVKPEHIEQAKAWLADEGAGRLEPLPEVSMSFGANDVSRAFLANLRG